MNFTLGVVFFCGGYPLLIKQWEAQKPCLRACPPSFVHFLDWRRKYLPRVICAAGRDINHSKRKCSQRCLPVQLFPVAA